MKKTIDPKVLEVLNAATIEGNVLKLNGQLDRKLYEDVNKVLTALGGKWNRNAKGYVFEEDPSDVVYDALATGEVIDNKKAFQQFFTPSKLAMKLASLLNLERDDHVLEPSAGVGALLDAVQAIQPNARITAIEIDKKCANQLAVHGYGVIYNDDFMTMELEGQEFTKVIMNPPFTGLQDVKHVLKAFNHLVSGGRLAAIMSPGWQFRNTHKCLEFRAFVEEFGVHVEEIEAGEFKESGTMIRTVMVVLEKP